VDRERPSRHAGGGDLPWWVSPNGDGWTVETLVGTELVTEQGEGRRLVPLDAEMANEFEERGPLVRGCSRR
jgi:hypothetical protein